MNPSKPFRHQDRGSYVPYFYAAGLHYLYLWPGKNEPVITDSGTSNVYDFSSLGHVRKYFPHLQTVEQVIERGYLATPRGDNETALLTDKSHTAWLGLDDLIDQVRHRREIYRENMYGLELSKCAAINSFHEHEAYHGPADAKVEYALNKRLDQLYSDQREERVKLWQDISRLRLVLPENAQNYLSAYRKLAILQENAGDEL